MPTAYQIAQFLEARGFNIQAEGDLELEISRPCSLKQPRLQGLTFYKPKRWDTQHPVFGPIACLITTSGIPDLRDNTQHFARLHTDNPRLAFITVVEHFYTKPAQAGIHPQAFIHNEAIIAPSAQIGPFASVGAGAQIGANTIISASVTVGENVRIGDNCFIGPGTALGQPGFGYERNAEGVLVPFPHIGGLHIGDDVHIGANTTIDRGTLDDTVIEDRVRIDNLCHISHNVQIGTDTAVIAHSMIGGSTSIGSKAWIAPSASIINGISVGASAVIGMGAVVVKPVTDQQTVTGVPAREIKDFKILQKALSKLAQ